MFIVFDGGGGSQCMVVGVMLFDCVVQGGLLVDINVVFDVVFMFVK